MLKIKLVDDLPQWVISSNTACYHPFSNTIWCRRDKWWLIGHELVHWISHKLGGKEHWLHKWVDGGKVNYK